MGEIALRRTAPFFVSRPLRFVPGAGFLGEPNAEWRETNGRDFRTTSRTNRWGFLDREPIAPERAAASCQVAVVGDSFVAASEVAVADKFPARLEERAAREFPERDLTVSAFGWPDTGQWNQVPFYDRFARRLSPKLLVLVTHWSDFADNSPGLVAAWTAYDPERMPYATGVPDGAGGFRLRPPDPQARTWRWERSAGVSGSLLLGARDLRRRLGGASHLFEWLYGPARNRLADRVRRENLEVLRSSPAPLFEGWDPAAAGPQVSLAEALEARRARGTPLPPAFAEAVRATGAALEEFRFRAERDRAAILVVLTPDLGAWAGPAETMRGLAEERGIPVLDLAGFLREKGVGLAEVRWRTDMHWNPTGHRWVAEALLEYWAERPEICADREAGSDDGRGSRGPGRRGAARRTGRSLVGEAVTRGGPSGLRYPPGERRRPGNGAGGAGGMDAEASERVS